MAKRTGEPCAGGGVFPDNYDGEYVRCGECDRKMNLDPQGLVPKHYTTPPPGYMPASEQRAPLITRRMEPGDE